MHIFDIYKYTSIIPLITMTPSYTEIINNTTSTIDIRQNVEDSYLGPCLLFLGKLHPMQKLRINMHLFSFLTQFGEYDILCLTDPSFTFYIRYESNRIYIETH